MDIDYLKEFQNISKESSQINPDIIRLTLIIDATSGVIARHFKNHAVVALSAKLSALLKFLNKMII
jgi:hypothetical protein